MLALDIVSDWHGEEAATQIWPTDVFPPGTPFTRQVSLLSAVPVTCAVNICRRVTTSVAVKGVTLTVISDGIAVMAMAREAAFDGSAAGSTDTETVFGDGAVAGAVKMATLVPSVLPTGVIVPQLAPEQPTPEICQDTLLLGFAPGITSIVAVNSALPLVTTLDGALKEIANPLVRCTRAEACFEGSATLCAMTVTSADDGRICGAVYFPDESTAPQLAVAQPVPETFHRTEVSRCPAEMMLAENSFTAPRSMLAEGGDSITWMSLPSVSCELSLARGSAALVAVTEVIR